MRLSTKSNFCVMSFLIIIIIIKTLSITGFSNDRYSSSERLFILKGMETNHDIIVMSDRTRVHLVPECMHRFFSIFGVDSYFRMLALVGFISMCFIVDIRALIISRIRIYFEGSKYKGRYFF
jgi:hypothetical protein